MSTLKKGAEYTKPKDAAPTEPRVVVPIDRGAVEHLLIKIPNGRRSQ